MKEIPLTQGKFALVDDDMFDDLNQWKWHLGKHGYAVRRITENFGKQRLIHMHRVINGTPNGLQTDHINGNPLDNRKENLRTATSSENQQNRDKQTNNTSGVTGVSWHAKGYWIAYVNINKKTKYICYTKNFDKAVLERKIMARQLYGEFYSERGESPHQQGLVG